MTLNLTKIKRDARAARRSAGTPITRYLNDIARQHGYHTWDNLVRAQPAPLPLARAAATGTDMHPHRKLMVLGLNAALDAGLVSLDGKDEPYGHLITQLAGETSVVRWNGISGDELSLAVWWKYDHSHHPQANLKDNARERFHFDEPLAKRQHFPRFVGVVVGGWLERLTGRHLQGHGGDHLTTYTRRGERQSLEALPNPVPRGYLAEGRFFR